MNLSEPQKVYGLKIENTETYVADGILTHNSIYGFKGGNVDYFLNLIKSPNWKTYYLKNNYRCGSKIINLGTKVIKQADDIINTETVCMSKNKGNIKIDSRFRIDNYLTNLFQNSNYKDWFILVRTNKDIVKLEDKLKRFQIPYVTFKKSEVSLNEMQEILKQNKVKLLTIHASKGLESPNVLLWGNFPIVQKPYLRNNDEIKILYVGITRAIDNLIILN